MIHPSYMLNPRDMFQVEPERVLFATGMGKGQDGAEEVKDMAVGAAIKAVKDANEEPSEVAESASSGAEFDAAQKETTTKEESEEASKELMNAHKEAVMKLSAEAKTLLQKKDDLTNKQKQALRALRKTMKSAISKNKIDEAAHVQIAAQFKSIRDEIGEGKSEKPTQDDELDKNMDKKISEAFERLKAADEENPVDATKPYATPWRPRNYMSAFAFIPRYLEVNQNICSAVYLRHPVARPGLAEVPTPFSMETSQLAFNWYLRRR